MKSNWATRTIRNGAVRIEGRIYEPQNQWKQYDGRLDGMRYLFGIYREPDGSAKGLVNLWGPAEYAKLNPDSAEADAVPRPEHVDGFMPWLFWEAQS